MLPIFLLLFGLAQNRPFDMMEDAWSSASAPFPADITTPFPKI